MTTLGRLTVIAGRCQRHPLPVIAFGVLLYGIAPVLVGASDATGPTLSFWRLWFGSMVLGGATVVAVRTGGAHWPSTTGALGRRGWKLACAAGAAFGLQQLTFFTAIKATSVTDVLLTNTLTPIVVTIAAVPLFGERPGARFRLWTLLAIAGAAVVVLGASAGPEGDPIGMALAVGSMLFFSAFFLISKQSRAAIDVLPFLFVSTSVSAVTVSAFAVVTGEALGAVTSRDLWFAFLIAAGPGAIGHFAVIWPLRWVAANVPPVMRLAQPIIGGLLAWAWLGQPVLGSHLLGGALTLAGVTGALTSRLGIRSPI